MRRVEERVAAEQAPAHEPAGAGSAALGQSLSAHPVLHLQQLIGNQAVVRLVQRETISGNPQDLQDSSGAQTTQHGTVRLGDAVDAPAAARAADQRGRRFVRVVAPVATPVEVPVATCPRPELIYEERQAAESGFTQVQGLHGTVDAPVIEQEADNSLYIDNQPRPSDVEQYGIGDCYGLSTIISIATRDPGKIKGMMAADGSGGAAVTFWKRKPKRGAPATGSLSSSQVEYEQVTVNATGQLAFELATPGVTGVGIVTARGGRQLHGAQLHAGQTPVKAAYGAAIASNRLEVHRADTYQMARWAPVLEKAWSRFAEVHGQYGQEGRGPDGSGEASVSATGGTAQSGYAAIDGGWSHRVMTAFYGAEAEPGGPGGVQQVATTFAPGSSAVLGNLPVVDQLLLLQGRGEHASPGDTTAPIITATAMNAPLVTRLGQAITAAQADPDWRNVKQRTQSRIRSAAAKVTAYQTATSPATTYATQAAATAAEQNAMNAVAAACVAAVRPGETWSVLGRADRSPAIRALTELMLDLRNAGTDHSTGQRNIYGNHVYSVVGFSVALTGGEAVPSPIPTGADRVAFYNKIDPVASSVRLQNPHHGNEPDPFGDNRPANPADGVPAGSGADGVFTFTLDQFLRNFTSVESGVFHRT
jgi:hypothetical protein